MADLVYPPVIVLVKSFWKYLGFRFDFQGQDNVPRKGGAILAINHTSYLDFALAGTAALPANRYVRFMAKKELFDNKVAGPLLRGGRPSGRARCRGPRGCPATRPAGARPPRPGRRRWRGR